MSNDERKEERQNIADLQENFNKQQAKISALKELVRKSEEAHGKSTSSTQEKVKNIAQRLTHLKTKARSRHNLDRSFSELRDDPILEESTQQSGSPRPISVISKKEQKHSFWAKISALKELVRKSEEAHGKSTSSTQEKVKNIAQRLTHLKTKARSRHNLDRSFSELRDDPILEESTQQSGSPRPAPYSKARSETPGTDKIQLLREEMEKNKLKMVEKENNKREIEKLVTQLKARIDSTQQSLDRSSELGRSMGDLTCLNPIPVSSKFKSSTDLSFTPLNLDKEKIKFLENRVKILEKQLEREKSTPKVESEIVKTLESKVLDLEENLKEKECIIEARTQAVSLMTESLSAKGKSTVDMLEDTKLEMFKMQSSFVEMEDDLKNEIERLKSTLEEKEKKILNLEEVNDILETARFDLTVKIAELENKTQNVQDYNTKINELNKINETLQQKIANLEDQILDPLSSQETDITKKVEEEYVATLKNLQERVCDLEKENDELKKLAQQVHDVQDTNTSDDDLTAKIRSLESTIEAQCEEIENQRNKIHQLEDQLAEKTTECNVLNANFSVLQEKLKASAPRSLFSTSSYEEAEVEINKLKTQLDEANKTMIKMKLKTKQLQKQVDGFNKISDVHTQLTKITGENEHLQQRILELEEEKGQLQLKLISGESSGTDGGELDKKIQILETTCQNQTSAIQLLEEQKLDMTENLQTTKQELESLKDQINDREETARVVSQIESIQLEEKANTYLIEIAELQNQVGRYKDESEKLTETVQKLQLEKEELNKKVDHYIAENIELLDKIEKLSKSSSSAESIEIVERLTHQEKLEIEEYNKRLEEEHNQDRVDNQVENPALNLPSEQAMGHELSESLTKLREESSELMHRIELFTTERREVLEKMETLTNENQENVNKINELIKEKNDIGTNLDIVVKEKSLLEKKCMALHEERNELKEQIMEANNQKELLTEQVNVLQKERNSVSKISQKCSIENNLLEICEKSLSKLNVEIENFTKATDKSSKVNSSKKLAKESKNTYKQMSELLQNIKTLQSETGEEEQIKDIIEKRSDLEKIIAKLQIELQDATSALDNKDVEINNLTSQLESIKEVAETATRSSKDYENEISILNQLRKDVESKLQSAHNEIEILKTLVAEQKQQLIESYTEKEVEMDCKLEKIEQYEAEIENLKRELEIVQHKKSQSYEKYVEDLKSETTKLEILLNENRLLNAQQTQELINKQETIDALNTQIEELYKTMEEYGNTIAKKEEEITVLVELVEKKSSDLCKIIKENDENKEVIERLLLELHSQTEKISQVESLAAVQEQNRQLENQIKELEKVNSASEMRCKEQHDKLKKFAANLKKKVSQCIELENKVKELTQNAQNVQSINIKSTNTELLELQHSDEQVDKLKSKLQELENNIRELHQDKELLRNELDRKQSELEHAKQQSEMYLTKIEETTVQLGEVQALVEILHSDFDEKRQREQRLQQQIDSMQKEHEEQLKTLLNDINSKNIKFEKCKAVIKEKNREIQRLSNEKDDFAQKLHSYENKDNIVGKDIAQLQEENASLKQEHSKLLETYEKEKVTFQETIARLETLHDGIQAKLQEDMAYIEALEMENNKFKEKIWKLEECVASFEERRGSLERQANLLDAQLQKKKDEYEQNEDALVYRLNVLSEHDDIIGRRLLETQEEKEELTDKLDRSTHEYTELMQKFTKLEKELESFQKDKYQNLELENQSMRDQVRTLQSEIDKSHSVYESKLAIKTAEIDDLENELSIQLHNVNIEKRSLQESLEKSNDEVLALKDEVVRLKENSNSLEQIKSDLEREVTWIRMQNENLSQDQFELQELRMQVMQDKTEIENQKHQLETLIQNHEIELNALKTQISELDSMRMQVSQNQTDDQVFIETENKRLKELLAEKEAVIDNYQRQNLQLQMSALSATATDPFATITSESVPESNTENREISNLKQKCREYEAEIKDLKIRAKEKDEDNSKLSRELTNLQQEIERINSDRQREIDSLKSELERLRSPGNGLASAFMFEQSSSNPFDEIVTMREVKPLEAEVHDQKKIEDLQRNVSDLEKYTTELENKLKHLTGIHEETLRQLQQKNLALEDLQKSTAKRIKELEKKEKQLNTQHNIEKIWSEEKAANVPSLSMFFDNASESAQDDQFLKHSEMSNPVEEETIVPKKAYLCYPKAESDSNKQDIGEDWGWGSEEAVLEEKHYHTTIGQPMSLLSPEKCMEIKLQENQDRIKELEIERDRLEAQKVELQVKSGKMMKKLKEYKNTIAQLNGSQSCFRKSSSIESNDLDLAIQEELKCQVTKLEEKVTEMKRQLDKDAIEKENLLKRVDVLTMANDRMTEMKERQDMEMQTYQTQIRQLNQKLKTLEDWSDNQNQAIQDNLKSCIQQDSTTGEQENWKEKYLEISQELEDLKVDRDELQALLDEEKDNFKQGENKIQALQAKINSLEENLPEQSQKGDLRRSLEAENQSLKNLSNELKLKNQELQLQLSDYQCTVEQLSNESNLIKANLNILRDEHQRKLDENSKLSNELQVLIESKSDLSREIETMRLRTNSASESHIEYDRKIDELQTKITELEREGMKKNNEISKITEDKNELIKLKENYEKEIHDRNLEITTLRSEIDNLRTEKDNFKQNVSTLELTLQELNSEKEHMENELEVLNNHVIVSLENEDKMKQTVLELDMKNIEISELKKSLEILKAQQSREAESKETVSQDSLQQMNSQWEALVEQRCGEVAESWRAHLVAKENEFNQKEANLRQELDKIKTHNMEENENKNANIKAESGEVNLEMYQKMQAALESQELEIVTLKEQLAMRSAEYARLAAQHDPYAQTTSSSATFDINILRKSSQSDQSTLVQKSELDLALYMLHQRDMRCEELTLELVNLLEERDTLQLKLSNSLRQMEEIKQKTGYFESGSESDQGVPSNPNTPEKSRLRPINTITEEDALKENEDLNTKLSQLHVDHPKDKRLLEERNQTQRDIDKIQEDVANIPSEAVSELVGKDLSTMDQSPSAVLLNWLWGKTSNQQQS